ncbi:MAG: hypothetical protein K0S32_3220 [Bacteroidetes bacterium]|jgi:glucan phosphoethanolaminetransferase (alkaline phosphatase superfamily)|nr:hypothetical protein [Bacteroidota bacterium]
MINELIPKKNKSNAAIAFWIITGVLLWGAVSGLCRSLVTGAELILIYSQVSYQNYLLFLVLLEVMDQILFFTLFLVFIKHFSKDPILPVGMVVTLIVSWIVFWVGSFYLSFISSSMLTHHFKHKELIDAMTTKGTINSVGNIVYVFCTVGIFVYFYIRYKDQNDELPYQSENL